MTTPEPYTYEPHRFDRMICAWRYCSKCGLVTLKNDFTQWCIRKGCNNEDHPSYASQRRKTGGQYPS